MSRVSVASCSRSRFTLSDCATDACSFCSAEACSCSARCSDAFASASARAAVADCGQRTAFSCAISIGCSAPHLALGICTAGRKVGTLLLQLPPKLVQLGGVGFDLSTVACLLCLFFLLSACMR